jgi:hypothetical protein
MSGGRKGEAMRTEEEWEVKEEKNEKKEMSERGGKEASVTLPIDLLDQYFKKL